MMIIVIASYFLLVLQVIDYYFKNPGFARKSMLFLWGVGARRGEVEVRLRQFLWWVGAVSCALVLVLVL